MKLNEFAEKLYPNSDNPISDMVRFAKRDTLIEGILIGAEFAEWVTHNDWVYLPSKQKWYNEEDEENITPLTTTELLEIFLTEKMKENDNGNS